jgi:DNA-binding MarR family transcriptional regulator
MIVSTNVVAASTPVNPAARKERPVNRRPHPAKLSVWRQFLVAHARVTGLLEDELRRERGLPLAWYDVLLQLSEAPDGRLRMQDLADSVLHSKSGLTRLFDRMEASGLVKREPCPFDRRGTFAVLTPEGRATLRRAAPPHLRGIEEHFTGLLTDEEAAVMETALTRVLAALEHPTYAQDPVSAGR